MKLSVATNFKPDFLDAIKGYPVAELFGKLLSGPLSQDKKGRGLRW